MTPTPLSEPINEQSLRGKPLLLARVGWVVVTLVVVGLSLYAIPTLYGEAAVPCPDQGPCGDWQFTLSQVAQLHAQGISTVVFATFNVLLQTVPVLIFTALAALLFWRRSHDRMALLCAYALVTFSGTVLSGATQALPTNNFAGFFLFTTLSVLGEVLFFVFFALFPDGHFVPRWTRWIALLWALGWLSAYFPKVPVLDAIPTIYSSPILVLVPVCMQIYRYRRVSDEQQRQQSKWVVYGFVVAMLLFVALFVFDNSPLVNSATPPGIVALVVNALFVSIFTLIPIALSIAILRYRLYDIDVIIRSTLVYGSLTAILVAIYAFGIVGAQALVGGITGRAGEQQPFVIVATTLLIAALFQPLRRNIQAFIDRRFYRTKYSAEKTLSAFSATLRSEVDLNNLSTHLVDVVEETMRPQHISLWLKPTLYVGTRVPVREDQGGDA